MFCWPMNRVLTLVFCCTVYGLLNTVFYCAVHGYWTQCFIGLSMDVWAHCSEQAFQCFIKQQRLTLNPTMYIQPLLYILAHTGIDVFICLVCLLSCYHIVIYLFSERERQTNIWNLVVSTTSDGGQIHLNPAAIRLTPTLHFDRQSASSIFKQAFMLF